MVINGCILLRNITINSEINRNKAGDGEGCKILCQLLELYVEDAEVCQHICGAIWNISIDRENEQKFHELQCCKLLMRVLKIHAGVAAVVNQVCGVLSNMRSLDYVDEGDSCEVLIHVLSSHQKDSQMAEDICNLLCNVVTNDTNGIYFEKLCRCDVQNVLGDILEHSKHSNDLIPSAHALHRELQQHPLRRKIVKFIFAILNFLANVFRYIITGRHR
jgi:hypothetical protein